MKLIKKNFKVIIAFILGALFSSGVIYAATLVDSSYVGYTGNSQSTVQGALNDLYTKASYGNAAAGDIKSGKTALVGGSQVTGTLSVPSYTTKSGTQSSISPGGSYTLSNGYYQMTNNFKVSCNSCDYSNYVATSSITNKSGTESVAAGASSTTLNGYYNMSNYKVSCGSSSANSYQLLGSGTYSISSTTERTITLSENPRNYKYILFTTISYSGSVANLYNHVTSFIDSSKYVSGFTVTSTFVSGTNMPIINCQITYVSDTSVKIKYSKKSGSAIQSANKTFYVYGLK